MESNHSEALEKRVAMLHGHWDLNGWRWLSAEAMSLLSRKLIHYSFEDIETAVDELAKKKDSRGDTPRPTGYALLRALDTAQRGRHASERSTGTREACAVCDSTGWFPFWGGVGSDEENEPVKTVYGTTGRIYEYVARCFCGEGRRLAAVQSQTRDDESITHEAYTGWAARFGDMEGFVKQLSIAKKEARNDRRRHRKDNATVSGEQQADQDAGRGDAPHINSDVDVG